MTGLLVFVAVVGLVYFGAWLPAKWDAKADLEEQQKPETYWQNLRR